MTSSRAQGTRAKAELLAQSESLRLRLGRDLDALRQSVGAPGKSRESGSASTLRRIAFESIYAFAGARQTSRLIAMAGQLTALLRLAGSYWALTRGRKGTTAGSGSGAQ